jgi:type VI secretion system protein ImpK
VIAAIATALRARPGGVAVLGYTDATPIRTVQFPSNFQFSTARARAVQIALQQGLGTGRPVTAEGRAEADPVADNATAAGRAQNQRIEIVLQPQAAGQ